MRDNVLALKKKANWVRNQILEMIAAGGAGHIGGSLSCVDILVAVYYGGSLHFDKQNENRDRFILSKGHSCAGLYAILADLGYFSVAELNKFQKEGCILGGHPHRKIPGIEADTGSLGHGLGIGAGLALSAKIDKKNFTTLVLMGDGECCEGSVWESAMFAVKHKLNNLVGIIDKNGLCSIDFLSNCLTVEPLSTKWEAFGWEVATVNGHSFEELIAVLGSLRDRKSDKPLMVVAETIKGKGISFMEGSPQWHHRVPKGEELESARRDLKWDPS